MIRRLIIWLLGMIASKRPKSRPGRRPPEYRPLPAPVDLSKLKPLTAADIKERLYAGEEYSGVFANKWGDRK